MFAAQWPLADLGQVDPLQPQDLASLGVLSWQWQRLRAEVESSL